MQAGFSFYRESAISRQQSAFSYRLSGVGTALPDGFVLTADSCRLNS